MTVTKMVTTFRGRKYLRYFYVHLPASPPKRPHATRALSELSEKQLAVGHEPGDSSHLSIRRPPPPQIHHLSDKAPRPL